MNLRRGARAVLLGTGILLAACGDDDNNSPADTGTEFTQEEKAALTTAFTDAGLIPSGGQEGQLYGLLLGGIRSYGTFTIPASLREGAGAGLRSLRVDGEHDATAVQYIFDISVNGEPSFQGLSAGIVAWSNLDVAAETVDDWISIGASDDTGTDFPDEVSGTVPDDVSAEYWVAATNTFYEGISGSASITSTSFASGTTDCSVTIPTVGVLGCSYQYGSQQGNFDFVATPVNAEGPDVTFASTSYDLPAVRVRLTGDLTVAASQVASVKASLRKMLRAK